MQTELEELRAFKQAFEQNQGRALLLLPILQLMKMPPLTVINQKAIYKSLATYLFGEVEDEILILPKYTQFFLLLGMREGYKSLAEIREQYYKIADCVNVDIKFLMPYELRFQVDSLQSMAAMLINTRALSSIHAKTAYCQALSKKQENYTATNRSPVKQDLSAAFHEVLTECNSMRKPGSLAAVIISDTIQNPDVKQSLANYLLLAQLLNRNDLAAPILETGVSLDDLYPKIRDYYHEHLRLNDSQSCEQNHLQVNQRK